MLTTYLDESGQESNDYVFIAGFLGNDDQWKQLAADWKNALGARKALHLSRLRWAYPKRVEKVLNRLGPIPHQCGLEPLFGGVRVSDYADLVKGTIDERLMAGYIAALYPLVIQMLKVVPPNERVEIVFEAQERYEPFVHSVLAKLMKGRSDYRFYAPDGSPKLASWRFASKESTIFFQPADFFAYALTQIYRDTKSEKSKLCMAICPEGEKSKAVGAVMTRNQVRNIIKLTRNLAALEMLSGRNLKPQTREEREQFNAMVREVVNGRPSEAK